MSETRKHAQREVEVVNSEGFHARPVMRFVDLASTFESDIQVSNVSGNQERLDGKSAMHLMLLEATVGCKIRIEAVGDDAGQAVETLANLVKAGFNDDNETQG